MIKTPLPGEFALIERYFKPLAHDMPAALGLSDDAAILDLPPGLSLVATTDAIVAGVHFLAGDPADLIARKLLRVNLSDLAAKGARPLGYLLTTAFDTSIDEDWIGSFVGGLAADQREFGIGLLGGDTVASAGPIWFSLTALGTVPRGGAYLRSGARAGDTIYVSGTIGDGVLGLAALTGRLPDLAAEDVRHLVDRYHLPRPRVTLGAGLAGIARGALDISDGLIADLGHLATASGLGAEIEATAVPLSNPARRALALGAADLATLLSGGDDYEILFTAALEAEAAVGELGRRLDLALTPIGRMIAGSGVRVSEAGKEMKVGRGGYVHF